MANQTYEVPAAVGDIIGAYDTGHWNTVVLELKPNSGVLTRGTVLSLVAGKLELTVATNEGTAYGVLLDPLIDTGAAYSDSSVTGSIARSGSFRGPTLIVGAGTNAATLVEKLRDLGIFVEGPITVPA